MQVTHGDQEDIRPLPGRGGTNDHTLSVRERASLAGEGEEGEMSQEEVEILKKHYGFTEERIGQLKREGRLNEIIEKIKMEHFLSCRHGRG